MCVPRDFLRKMAVAALIAVICVGAGAEAKDASGADVQNTSRLRT